MLKNFKHLTRICNWRWIIFLLSRSICFYICKHLLAYNLFLDSFLIYWLDLNLYWPKKKIKWMFNLFSTKSKSSIHKLFVKNDLVHFYFIFINQISFGFYNRLSSKTVNGKILSYNVVSIYFLGSKNHFDPIYFYCKKLIWTLFFSLLLEKFNLSGIPRENLVKKIKSKNSFLIIFY